MQEVRSEADGRTRQKRISHFGVEASTASAKRCQLNWFEMSIMWTRVVSPWKVGRQRSSWTWACSRRWFSVPLHDDQKRTTRSWWSESESINYVWAFTQTLTRTMSMKLQFERNWVCTSSFFYRWSHWRNAVTLETSLITVFLDFSCHVFFFRWQIYRTRPQVGSWRVRDEAGLLFHGPQDGLRADDSTTSWTTSQDARSYVPSTRVQIPC